MIKSLTPALIKYNAAREAGNRPACTMAAAERADSASLTSLSARDPPARCGCALLFLLADFDFTGTHRRHRRKDSATDIELEKLIVGDRDDARNSTVRGSGCRTGPSPCLTLRSRSSAPPCTWIVKSLLQTSSIVALPLLDFEAVEIAGARTYARRSLVRVESHCRGRL